MEDVRCCFFAGQDLLFFIIGCGIYALQVLLLSSWFVRRRRIGFETIHLVYILLRFAPFFFFKDREQHVDRSGVKGEKKGLDRISPLGVVVPSTHELKTKQLLSLFIITQLLSECRNFLKSRICMREKPKKSAKRGFHGRGSATGAEGTTRTKSA